jgi:diadenosine tetraphosphatase ApaH/serine/threonine PP2A family protein phosphatase
MRYGIFSDTHANLPALEAVMRSFDSLNIDALICLGDTVGYGSQPNECCDIVRKNAKFTILGNHDAAVAGRMDYSYYYDAAREALDYHSRVLTEENMGWLRGLPYIERDEHTHFCHGSPVDLEEFEYIFSVEQAATCIPIWERLGQATFIGHSHLCKAFAVSKERVFEVVTREFEVRTEYRYVISVGSVGQPRDHDPRASYTVYDSANHRFEFRRVEYDIAEAARRIYDIGQLSDSFGARLFAGV